MDNIDRIKQIVDSVQFTCPVCGSDLYVTDYGRNTITFHCSSESAKFWTFENGSKALIEAKEHWEASMREVSLNE
jgi:competence CoiA-like predicted nuclease